MPDRAFALFEALSRQLPPGPQAFLDSSDAAHMPASRGRRSLLAFGTETAAPSAEELPAWLESVWPGGADWFGMIEYELTGYFFRAERSVIVDHSTGGLEIRGEPGWHELVEAAVADLVVEEPQSVTPVLTDLCVRDSRAEYLSKVAAAKEEIRRGNSYEVCLTTAVCGTLHGDAMSAYRRLRSANRAPFTQLLILPEADGGTVEVLSTSPERFLSVAPDGTMRSEPIKGTRPRGSTPESDAALLEELRTDPKDRAENIMIADLVRNDLSKHSQAGTLRTERLCAVESYPTVHQMVSTISARLAPGASRAAAVLAAFPPGSMTGAPKISTMEILRRLEGGSRGPYAGAAGHFGSDGSCDLSVLIRTAVLRRTPGAESASFHLGVGGAITSDSVAEREWDEVLVKARGVLGALGAGFPER